MSTSVSRPRTVLLAGILLIATGIFHTVGWIIVFFGTPPEEAFTAPTIVFMVGTVVIGILNIVLAIGVLRGNRVARLIATILQAITVLLAVIGLFSAEAAQDITRYVMTAIVTPLGIIALLWVGAQTKEFFARRN